MGTSRLAGRMGGRRGPELRDGVDGGRRRVFSVVRWFWVNWSGRGTQAMKSPRMGEKNVKESGRVRRGRRHRLPKPTLFFFFFLFLFLFFSVPPSSQPRGLRPWLVGSLGESRKLRPRSDDPRQVDLSPQPTRYRVRPPHRRCTRLLTLFSCVT